MGSLRINIISSLVALVFLLSFTACHQESISQDAITPLQEVPKKQKQQRIEDRIEQEKEMTLDPALGYVPKKELIKARKVLKAKQAEMIQKNPIPNVTWDERGPNNVGGRTRALMFDPNDATNKKVWAGSVGGGVWYSDDITATNANWQKVDDFWSNMAVSSLAHDPVLTNNFYAGTGEGFGNADAIDGDGIWKSTNGGTTWNQLSSTTAFNDCNKIVCFATDKILVATNNGLRLSINGGSTWTTVRSGSHSDADKSKDGDLYASNFQGDVFKSTDDGLTWATVRNGAGARVEIATAPSDNNIVYALVNSGGQVSDILRSSNAGASWVSKVVPPYKSQNCSDDATNSFARGQGWYDLISLVSANDPDKIIIGGVDLFRSEDGGNSWGTISYWTGGCDAYVHADQHALILKPGSNDAILAGNDGGVSYSSNAFSTGSNPTWNTQNEGYNVTQFYGVAIHPTAGVNNIIAGAQDNGTKRLTSNGIGGASNVTGGDGAYCHIDQDTPNNQISQYVYNNYYISTNGSSFPSYSLGNFGRFINPTDYDNTANKLYACSNSNEYVVISGVGGTLSNDIKTVAGFGGQISAVKVSPNVSNRVYFGINNSKICYVDNAAGTPTLTSLGNPASGYISSIDVEIGNENHILATYSNYGITSVWESINAGSNWTAVEGDLPNMPVRWGMFDPNNADQVLIATELGVWSTDNLNGSNTLWNPTNSGLANVRVDMLDYRTSDNLVVAATHGRGVYTSESFNLACNIGNLVAGTQICDPNTSTYTQEISLTLNNTPSSGQVSVHGQNFSFPYNQVSTTQTYTLTGLSADGQAVDVDVHFTAELTCEKTIVDAFTAPLPGCASDNDVCADAQLMLTSGTYATNGPASGNGCNNCGTSQHADWWKFTAPSNGTIDIASCLGGVDTRFWVYEGSCASLTAIGGNDDACPMTTGGNAWASEQLGINVISGTTYFIEWDDRWDTGGFDFDFTFTPAAGCASQNYLCFDPSATGNGSGCDWQNAVPNLQSAIDLAAQQPVVTEIWIKAGTYKPGASGTTPTRSTSFQLGASTISLLGGFIGTETLDNERDPSVNTTILSGDIGLPVISTDNSYHIINHSSSNALTLDGLTIQNGNANSAPDLAGAGIQNMGSLTLINCFLKDNLSTNSGTAILNTTVNATINMENVEFENNGAVPLLNANGANIIVTANSNTIMIN